ncbi:hypothetical protein N431DRAFT_430843 [Stipitochalara longipes BDJ]|nr:hypothetical protein N431DRAFT_430843 [Stipitochalara longipes BDJ]
MLCKLLDYLPREIRAQIYAYVLAPTGHITPKRSPTGATLCSVPPLFPNGEINLSLLQTCRQIYQESKDVLWKDNILCFLPRRSIFDPKEDVAFVHSDCAFARYVRIVELRFTPSHFDLAKVITFIQPLGSWGTGSLREVRFKISGMGTMTMFGESVSMIWQRAMRRRRYPHLKFGGFNPTSLFGIFALAGNEEHGHLRHLRRRLDIELGIRLSSPKARREWFSVHKPEDCEETLQELHRSLGGDLCMDGVLCYKDGLRLRETFATWEAESQED